MITKTLVAALILASASVALTAKAGAAPAKQEQASQETSLFERASRVIDGGN